MDIRKFYSRIQELNSGKKILDFFSNKQLLEKSDTELSSFVNMWIDDVLFVDDFKIIFKDDVDDSIAIMISDIFKSKVIIKERKRVFLKTLFDEFVSEVCIVSNDKRFRNGHTVSEVFVPESE